MRLPDSATTLVRAGGLTALTFPAQSHAGPGGAKGWKPPCAGVSFEARGHESRRLWTGGHKAARASFSCQQGPTRITSDRTSLWTRQQRSRSQVRSGQVRYLT
jgi:hypothetical protein